MGQIKSTIELMMERTKGMSLSPEERENLRIEGMRKKAKGYRLKLLEHPDEINKFLNALQDETEAEAVETYIWEEFLDGFPDDKSIFAHVDLMKQLPGAGAKSSPLEKLRHDLKSHFKDKVSDTKKDLAKEVKKLASLGIAGSALAPKLPKEGTKASISDIVDRYRKDLIN